MLTHVTLFWFYHDFTKTAMCKNCNVQQQGTGKHWEEEHFSLRLKERLSLPEEVYEALKTRYLGKEIPQLPDYMSQQGVAEAGFRSADEYSLFSRMRWGLG